MKIEAVAGKLSDGEVARAELYIIPLFTSLVKFDPGLSVIIRIRSN